MTSSSSDSRKERLAAALKENLKRRKAQAKAKASGSAGPGDARCPDEPPAQHPDAAAKRHSRS